MLKGKPKTDKKLVWTSDCKVVFNKTKSILSQASLLVYPVINAPTSLMVDASDWRSSANLLERYLVSNCFLFKKTHSCSA